MDIDEIIEFVVENGGNEYAKMPAEEFIDAIKKHDEYGTMTTVRDKKGIVALARWNWTDEESVEVLDCIVRKDRRSPRMIKYLVYLGKKRNPKIKYMTYQRLYKYPYKKRRRVKVGG